MYQDTERYSTSKWIMYGVTSLLTFDQMSTFYIIFLYWISLGGTHAEYGVVFGLYSFGKAIGSPFVGRFGDKIGIRQTLSVCMFLMVLGNMLFFFASSQTYDLIDGQSNGFNGWTIDTNTHPTAGGRWLLIIGRTITGMGSSATVLVESYLMQTTPDDQKATVTNRFRQFAMAGAIVGCTYCTALLYIPFNHVWYPFQLDAFTIPVLTSGTLETIAAVFVFFSVQDLIKEEEGISLNLFSSSQSQSLMRSTAILNVANFFVLMGVWVFFSELVVLGGVYWGVIDSFSNIWVVYIPVLIGSFASFLAVRILTNRFALDNPKLMVLGPFFAAIGAILLFGYSSPPSTTLFYVGAAVVFLGQGVYQTGFRAFYGSLSSQSTSPALLTAFALITSGLGCFIGSAIGSALLNLDSFGECLGEGMKFGDCVEDSTVKGVNTLIGMMFGCLIVAGSANAFLVQSGIVRVTEPVEEYSLIQ